MIFNNVLGIGNLGQIRKGVILFLLFFGVSNVLRKMGLKEGIGPLPKLRWVLFIHGLTNSVDVNHVLCVMHWFRGSSLCGPQAFPYNLGTHTFRETYSKSREEVTDQSLSCVFPTAA